MVLVCSREPNVLIRESQSYLCCTRRTSARVNCIRTRHRRHWGRWRRCQEGSGSTKRPSQHRDRRAVAEQDDGPCPFVIAADDAASNDRGHGWSLKVGHRFRMRATVTASIDADSRENAEQLFVGMLLGTPDPTPTRDVVTIKLDDRFNQACVQALDVDDAVVLHGRIRQAS